MLFVFGTLMDAKTRFRVLGRTLPRSWIRPVRVDGYVRVQVAGRPYPMLAAKAGGRVMGLAIRNLSPRDFARLDEYEGEEYIRAPVGVRLSSGRMARAETYLCPSWVAPSGKKWPPAYGVLRSRSFCQ